MKEQKDAVTMKGQPLTLVGNPTKVGDKLPEFTVIKKDLSPFNASSILGKVSLLFSVPSLDTSVCSRETHEFSKSLAKFGDQVAAYTISMDLPFAQGRWCLQEGVSNLNVLSDYREASFGLSCGLLIKELRLLARAVFVVDQNGIIRYQYLCKEVASEPPYAEVLQNISQLLAGSK
jgi:thiol peroxidase